MINCPLCQAEVDRFFNVCPWPAPRIWEIMKPGQTGNIDDVWRCPNCEGLFFDNDLPETERLLVSIHDGWCPHCDHQEKVEIDCWYDNQYLHFCTDCGGGYVISNGLPVDFDSSVVG